MTISSAPVKKPPWLGIVIGIVLASCLCFVLLGAAYLAFFIPVGTSNVPAEQPVEVVIASTEMPVQANTNPFFAQAQPAGSAVDIGNNMDLTLLHVTRPADDIVANGSVLNTTAPEGEEFMQVDVQVTCRNEAGTQCRFYPTVIKVLLADGSTRDLQIFIEGVDDWDTTIDLEGSTTQQGDLLFIVPKGDANLVLTYQDVYADQPVYLQLP